MGTSNQPAFLITIVIGEKHVCTLETARCRGNGTDGQLGPMGSDVVTIVCGADAVEVIYFRGLEARNGPDHPEKDPTSPHDRWVAELDASSRGTTAGLLAYWAHAKQRGGVVGQRVGCLFHLFRLQYDRGRSRSARGFAPQARGFVGPLRADDEEGDLYDHGSHGDGREQRPGLGSQRRDVQDHQRRDRRAEGRGPQIRRGWQRQVRVPPSIEGPFAQAEEIVSKYFRDRKDDPARGTIEIFGERYVLVRAASMSVEFFRLVYELYGTGREREAEEFAHNILFDLAHSIGKSDARNFSMKMELDDPIARLSAGPIHFAHAGWAFVDIFPESQPSPDDDYFLVYDHPYSFESDAWMRAGRTTDFAACIMNAGYSSGWCEESFGIELVATEVMCRARGDGCCRFVMAPPKRIEERAAKWMLRKEPNAAPSSFRIPDFFSRKRMEEELRHARDELEVRVEERTTELQESSKKLAQAQRLESVGRLAGGIAHDFNNLMAVIIGNAGLAIKQLDADHPARPFLDEIAASGQRAAALTRQLLAFSRAQPYAPEVLDLAALVVDLGRMLERLIGDDVRLSVRITPDVGLIEADRAQVEQVVVNLAVNARDAMPEGGTLEIALGEIDVGPERAALLGVSAGRFVELGVADDGIGMTDEVAAHVFDPFFTTKEAGKGTGLGLSTVYGVAKQSGGAVVLSTKPGAGSRFAVLFPRVRGRIGAPPPVPAEQHAVALGNETILLVEDQAALREVVGKLLRDAGYVVLETSDPEEAMRLGRDHPKPIDLLLTDVMMPGITGPQLALRLLGERPKLKVLYMSGYPGSAIGPTLLLKPFSPQVLGARIREALEEK